MSVRKLWQTIIRKKKYSSAKPLEKRNRFRMQNYGVLLSALMHQLTSLKKLLNTFEKSLNHGCQLAGENNPKTYFVWNFSKRTLTRHLFLRPYICIWLEFRSRSVFFILVFHHQPRHWFRNPDRPIYIFKESYSRNAWRGQGFRGNRHHFNGCYDFLLRSLLD